ncbi:hypothetical protein [uncultured Shewanella sp.]|uniref:hypothetical protein n=1 Tax=uncultured Shewanella sp. TaxID=173975 RepID=UPI00262F6CFA|nr:hypothetical protein [uncultured Shewanella sp.]
MKELKSTYLLNIVGGYAKPTGFRHKFKIVFDKRYSNTEYKQSFCKERNYTECYQAALQLEYIMK